VPVPPRIAVACLQLATDAGETLEARVARVVAELEAAPDADLVVLPELWDVGFSAFGQYESAARPLGDGPLAPLARVTKTRGWVLVAGSVIERDGGSLHNTIAVLGPDGVLLGKYRKRHLFAYDALEVELLTPGDRTVIIDTRVGRLGLATCFDLRFPEQFAEMRSLGADLMVVPAQWPSARIEHWRVLAQARAIETQTPLIGCNATGPWHGVDVGGSSVIVDARGRVLVDAGPAPGWVNAQLDPADTAAWRAEFPLRA